MLKTLKSHILKAVDQWLADIRASPEKKTTLDISKVFEHIFASNIVHLCFGKDMMNERFEIDYLVDVKTLKTEKRMINVQDALNHLLSILPFVIMNKPRIPINWLYPWTGYSFDPTTLHKLAKKTINQVHGFIRAQV